MKKVILFVIAFMFLFSLSSVSALSQGVCVVAEISGISPSSIGVNEEFTVGVQIENCGSDLPESVSFELLNPPIDIQIKESLVINVSQLYYGNSERFLLYHMKTTADAQPGSHLIKARLSYGRRDVVTMKDYSINIEVIGDEAELSIASLKTNPVLPRKGETIELTMRIENTGDGTAKSVEVNLDHPFQGSKQSFIGALDSDEDGPAILTFIVDESGEFEFPVTISYKDDFGENEIKSNLKLNVLRKESNFGIIIFVIFILLVFVGGIYYFLKIKKSKDRIIKQLLQGESVELDGFEEIPDGRRVVKQIKKSRGDKEERKKKERRRQEFKRELLKKYKR